MVQSINTKALLTIASILRKPGLLVPHVTVQNISEINYDALKKNANIKAIVFDKDNTLTIPYDNEQIHPKAIAGLQNAQRVFGTNNIAILSNSVGCTSEDSNNYEEARYIERTLHINVIRHDEKKPGGIQDVLNHFRITDPCQICMIGDRILTDIVFGNLYGMLTIHTMPLTGTRTTTSTSSSTTTTTSGGDDESIAFVTATTSNNNDNNENNISNDTNNPDNWTAKLLRPLENKLLYNTYTIGIKLRQQRIPHKYWNHHNNENNDENNDENNNDGSSLILSSSDNNNKNDYNNSNNEDITSSMTNTDVPATEEEKI